MFIYLVRNKVNGKVYIGKTAISVEGRWRQHLHAAANGSGCRRLGRAIRKYGADAFEVSVLESTLREKESRLMA